MGGKRQTTVNVVVGVGVRVCLQHSQYHKKNVGARINDFQIESVSSYGHLVKYDMVSLCFVLQ